MNKLETISKSSKSWPFVEALRIINNAKKESKGVINLQTGYGPSGLPHIGTFGEVARTTMILNAIEAISDFKVNLIAFSDDMDGLRKVPDNIPNQDILKQNLNKPLTKVPDVCVSVTAVVLLTVECTNPVAPLLFPFTKDAAGHCKGLSAVFIVKLTNVCTSNTYKSCSVDAFE